MFSVSQKWTFYNQDHGYKAHTHNTFIYYNINNIVIVLKKKYTLGTAELKFPL